MNKRAAILYALYLLVLGELAARTFWALGRGTSFWRPPTIVYFFYPELESLAEGEPDPERQELRVLLLGGSVLDENHGRVAPALHEQLAARTGRAVTVHNLSEPGHTTLDSLHKYRRLGHRRFTAVVVYHGVNEVRANNLAADRFDPDYGHYSWYRRINALDRHPELPFLALPYTLHYVGLMLDHRLRPAAYLPRHRPSVEARRHGAEIKTAAPFSRNLGRILALAAERSEPIVLMTFAYHLAPGYSPEAFDARQLDYGSHATPIELWGEPANVIAGLEAHNRQIRLLAARHPEALFVDQQALLPKSGEIFDDLCHLTPRGSLEFARNIADRLPLP